MRPRGAACRACVALRTSSPRKRSRLGGGDRGQRQVALDPHLAVARVREAQKRDLAVPAQQVVRVDPARLDDLRLRAQHAVADRDADVQRPAARVDRETPLGERDLPCLALQAGDVGLDDGAWIVSHDGHTIRNRSALQTRVIALSTSRPRKRSSSAGGDGDERQVALDRDLAVARVGEAHERDLAVPAQQVVRVDAVGLDHLRLRAQHAVAERDADVQRPPAASTVMPHSANATWRVSPSRPAM